MRPLLLWLLLGGLLGDASLLPAEESPSCGKLFIIGGGLRPDNAAMYQRIIESAGGREHARLALFRCASESANPAREAGETFVRYGISRDRLTIVDLTPENADRQAFSPQIVDQIRRSSGAYFTGGDQSRITRAFLKPDGGATPALLALKDMWRRGGVIAGTSAGAAMQSSRMLNAAGLPEDSLDEGMDALDFGIRRDLRHRGLLVTEGLGFFHAGIVDQHFSQYRGRLGRLARAVIEEHIRFGFGVDENTAMLVSGDSRIEVVGTGNLTIVDAANARCNDGPLGCRIAGVRLSCLQSGDRFDPATGAMMVRPEKKPIEEGSQDFNGNHLIADIAGPGAVPWAMFSGLAKNSSRKQLGITLRYNRGFGHGYRFTFAKTEKTVAYGGYVDHFYSHAVDGIRLDISPILYTQQDPQNALPVDLPSGPARSALEGLWFRGILLADERGRLRPAEPILRAELANALDQSVHLTTPRRDLPRVTDVDPSAEEVVRVVAAGLMKLAADGRFRPGEAVARIDAAKSLLGFAERQGMKCPPANPFPLKDEIDLPVPDRAAVFTALRAGFMRVDKENRFRPASFLTRQEAAEALYGVIRFSW